jgi:hypothetical protein
MHLYHNMLLFTVVDFFIMTLTTILYHHHYIYIMAIIIIIFFIFIVIVIIINIVLILFLTCLSHLLNRNLHHNYRTIISTIIYKDIVNFIINCVIDNNFIVNVLRSHRWELETNALLKVFGIRNIWIRIRILVSVLLNYGSGSWSFLQRLQRSFQFQQK